MSWIEKLQTLTSKWYYTKTETDNLIENNSGGDFGYRIVEIDLDYEYIVQQIQNIPELLSAGQNLSSPTEVWFDGQVFDDDQGTNPKSVTYYANSFLTTEEGITASFLMEENKYFQGTVYYAVEGADGLFVKMRGNENAIDIGPDGVITEPEPSPGSQPGQGPL